MPTDRKKLHFRLVLLGSHGTGKTSLINRFLFKKFEVKYKPTVEDLFSKDFDLQSTEIKVDFLDTSGSMQFPAMRRLSITTGSAFLIVYAVDDSSSYDAARNCLAEILEVRADYREIPIVFAGNKCDLPKGERVVQKEVVSNYVHFDVAHLRAKVIECSCKDNTNIDEIFGSYLSLAKVTLSPEMVANLSRVTRMPISRSPRLPERQNTCATTGGSASAAISTLTTASASNSKDSARRTSSLGVVLGLLESCDSQMVACGLIDSPKDSSQQHHTADSSDYANRVDLQLADCPENELNLEAAIKFSSPDAHKKKPRSRSLMWRPSRKYKSGAKTSDCQVS